MPKAAVVGTGVIGTIYASILQEQGWSVDHLVRRSAIHIRPRSVEVDLLDLRKVTGAVAGEATATASSKRFLATPSWP
ncbi:MAG: hypothetical protein ABSF89_02175 [Acidimicrobiales bacterium]